MTADERLNQLFLEHRRQGHDAMRGLNFTHCFTCHVNAFWYNLQRVVIQQGRNVKSIVECTHE